MPATTLTITLQPNSVANSVVVSIPSALQTFETTGQGSAADQAVRAIFRAHVFTPDGKVWYSASQIISIVAS